jgi:high-affinity nickel-transport protein
MESFPFHDLWPLLGLAFALGLSHGADPDHLTAIDGMVRASVDRYPLLSRWVGTWFALGHTGSVLAVAALIALALEHVGEVGASMKRFSWLVSSLLLFAIGTVNLLILVRSGSQQDRGNPAHKHTARYLGRRWMAVPHPLLAIPLGALFGLGFETASQMSAWALAGSLGHGVSGAMSIAAVFATGMMITDTANAFMVRRLYLTAARGPSGNSQMMTVTVIGLAYAIGVIKLLQPTPFALPISDLGLTVCVISTVLLAFVLSLIQVKRPVVHS